MASTVYVPNAKPKDKNKETKEPKDESSAYLEQMLRKEPSEKLLNNVLTHIKTLEKEDDSDELALGEHYIAAAKIARKLGKQAESESYMEKATKYISDELYKQAVRMGAALAAKGAKEVTVGVTVLGIQVQVTFEINTLIVAPPVPKQSAKQ